MGSGGSLLRRPRERASCQRGSRWSDAGSAGPRGGRWGLRFSVREAALRGVSSRARRSSVENGFFTVRLFLGQHE